MSQAVIIICTRPDSSRIKRKAFRKIAGLPAIEHILRRISQNDKPIYQTILAVPTDCREYDHLAKLYGVTIFEGDADSPLHRMAMAYARVAQGFSKPRYVVRITHDDILIDARTMTDLVERAIATDAGYATTPSIIDGAGVEVIDARNLLAAAERHRDVSVEHVSYFVRGPANGLPNDRVLVGEVRHSIERPYRLTMDYEEDVHILEAVLRALGQGPTPALDEICHFLDMHQELTEHNRLPEVTFYTCAFNAEPYIERSMASVLVNMGTRKSPSEYIVIDDASTDKTLAKSIITKRGDDRVHIFVNEDNRGLASSSNRAISLARGKYVMRIDADDYLLPSAFSEMRSEMAYTGAAIVYANYNTIDESGEVIERNVPARLHHHAGCALMNLKLLNEIKFREGLKHWDGLDLLKRVREHFPVAYVEKPLWLYRIRKDSMSNTKLEERSIIKRVLGL